MAVDRWLSDEHKRYEWIQTFSPPRHRHNHLDSHFAVSECRMTFSSKVIFLYDSSRPFSLSETMKFCDFCLWRCLRKSTKKDVVQSLLKWQRTECDIYKWFSHSVGLLCSWWQLLGVWLNYSKRTLPGINHSLAGPVRVKVIIVPFFRYEHAFTREQ